MLGKESHETRFALRLMAMPQCADRHDGRDVLAVSVIVVRRLWRGLDRCFLYQGNHMKRMAILVTVMVLLSTAIYVMADQNDDDRRRMLIGLDVVEMFIEVDCPTISQAAMKSAIELEMRRLGIKVAGSERDGTPYLFIRVECVCPDAGTCVVGADAHFRQIASLDMEALISKYVSTWTYSKYGVTGSKAYPSMAREIMRDVVQYFANDYLAANPEQAVGREQVPNPSSAPKSQKVRPKPSPTHQR